MANTTQTISIKETTNAFGHHSDKEHPIIRTFPGKITGINIKSQSFSLTQAATTFATAAGGEVLIALKILQALGWNPMNLGEGGSVTAFIAPDNPNNLAYTYWCGPLTDIDIEIDVTFATLEVAAATLNNVIALAGAQMALSATQHNGIPSPVS